MLTCCSWPAPSGPRDADGTRPPHASPCWPSRPPAVNLPNYYSAQLQRSSTSHRSLLPLLLPLSWVSTACCSATVTDHTAWRRRLWNLSSSITIDHFSPDHRSVPTVLLTRPCHRGQTFERRQNVVGAQQATHRAHRQREVHLRPHRTCLPIHSPHSLRLSFLTVAAGDRLFATLHRAFNPESCYTPFTIIQQLGDDGDCSDDDKID